MADLEKAIELAVTKHKGQKDKAGRPYILHPIKVMLGNSGENEMIAGILHDIVEDTDCTIEDLMAGGFPDAAIEAVKLLTHNDNESYEDYLLKIKSNPVARKVKLADLKDNMDITRISNLTEKDLKRLQKYHKAWGILNG